MATYMWMKHLHVLTTVISITLFVLRFYWQSRHSAALQQKWVKIVPHLNDTVLLLSGVALVFITRFYPFSPQGTWLTEKLFGVIIYIALGFIVLSKKPRSQKVRWGAFIVALGCIALIIKLAVTKMPLLVG